MSRPPTSAQRRNRLITRALPLAVLSIGAFTAGILVSSGSDERDVVDRFGAAWEAGDYDAMYAELTPGAQADYDADEFEQTYAEAASVATTEAVDFVESRGPLEQDGETVVALDVSVDTASFGEVAGEIAVPIADGAIAWEPRMAFPGLGEGQSLERKTKLAERAPILAADRSPLAEGPADARSTTGAGGIVTGDVGKPRGELAKELEASGFPEDASAGLNGLELAFNSELAGTPGGELLATGGEGEATTLAQSEPVAGQPVRTTIDTDLQESTASALASGIGDKIGGAALLDAKNGNVLAVAGFAFSAPQPPGSTFKVVTTTGALKAGITSPDEKFPVVTSAVVGGREVSNAYDEPCGGTLVYSFAHSCNSVFGPLGEELGGKKLVEEAELYGFNAPPTLYNEEALAAVEPLESTIPPDLEDAEAGISAIGQGEVQATPLEMASIAQTIANGGVRSPTAIVRDPALAGDYPDVKVTPPDIAAQVTEMMVAVVETGTGTAAAVDGATVAGKTGTAELGTSSGEPIGSEPPELDVNAWFLAFAPAEKPKYAVAVMVVQAEADGGTIAAPIAGSILQTALAG